MKLFVAILKLTIIFIKLTKKRVISPEPMERPPSRAERPLRRARRVEEGDVRRPERRIIECFQMKIDTTWPATQVGPRPVKSGQRGHDAGVSGVDDGVKNSSILLWKRGRTAQSVHASFSDFRVVDDQNGRENRNGMSESAPMFHVLCLILSGFILPCWGKRINEVSYVRV